MPSVAEKSATGRGGKPSAAPTPPLATPAAPLSEIPADTWRLRSHVASGLKSSITAAVDVQRLGNATNMDLRVQHVGEALQRRIADRREALRKRMAEYAAQKLGAGAAFKAHAAVRDEAAKHQMDLRRASADLDVATARRRQAELDTRPDLAKRLQKIDDEIRQATARRDAAAAALALVQQTIGERRAAAERELEAVRLEMTLIIRGELQVEQQRVVADLLLAGSPLFDQLIELDHLCHPMHVSAWAATATAPLLNTLAATGPAPVANEAAPEPTAKELASAS